MAVAEGLVKELESTQKFFKTTLSIFTPDERRVRSLSTPVRHSWELIREQSPVS